jgi:hypothetical protein
MALVNILMGAVHKLLLQCITTDVEKCIHTHKFDKKSLSVEAAAASFNKGGVARVLRSPVVAAWYPNWFHSGRRNPKRFFPTP